VTNFSKGDLKAVQDIIRKLTIMLRYEYSFTAEIKGEKQTEALDSLVDLIPFLYDTEAISLLLLVLAEKSTYEEYDKSHVNWIKELFKFVDTLLRFFQKYDFDCIIGQISEVPSLEDEIKKSILTLIKELESAHHHKLGISKDLNDSELIELKRFLLINKDSIAHSTFYTILAEITLLINVRKLARDRDPDLFNLFFATGTLFGKIIRILIIS
jgi:hypothetical protein